MANFMLFVLDHNFKSSFEKKKTKRIKRYDGNNLIMGWI